MNRTLEAKRAKFTRNIEQVVGILWDAFNSGLDAKFSGFVKESQIVELRTEENLKENPAEPKYNFKDLIDQYDSILTKVQEGKVRGYSCNTNVKLVD